METGAKVDKIDWTKELINCLIENYETSPCLYDATNKFNTNKHARNEALLHITCELKKIDGRLDINDVKKKITSMRQHFSHENSKIQESLKSGAGIDDMYEPSVWWFDKLLFLSSHIKTRKSKSSLDTLIKTSETISMEEDESCSSLPSTSSTPRIKKRKMQMQDDPIIAKTVATLEQLEKNFNASTNEKSDSQVYGDYVAREISKIKHEGTVNDLMHNINNCIYDAKKKWEKLQEQQQQHNFVIEVVDEEL